MKLLAIAFFAFVAASSFAQNKVVQATRLVTLYEANAVLCDEELKGRRISVAGKIRSIDKDILGTPYVAFRGPQNTFCSVQCFFTKADTEALMNLLAGHSVTISGVVKGKLMNVILEDCKIIARH